MWVEAACPPGVRGRRGPGPATTPTPRPLPTRRLERGPSRLGRTAARGLPGVGRPRGPLGPDVGTLVVALQELAVQVAVR